MGASDVKAGKVVVEITSDDVKLRNGLTTAETSLKRFGARMEKMGARMSIFGGGIAGGIAALATAAAKSGAEIYDLSKRTGMSAESLSVMRYAAKQTGVEFSGFIASIAKMQRAISDAGDGSKKTVEAFKNIGVSVDLLTGKNPADQFKIISNAISKIPDPAQRTAAAMDIFGRGAAALVPLMAEGASGFDALSKRAESLGLVLSTEAVKAADEFDDAMADLSETVKRMGLEVGMAAMPVIKDLANDLTGLSVSAGKFIRENKDLVVTVLEGAAAWAALGAVMSVGGKLLKTFTSIVSVAGQIKLGQMFESAILNGGRFIGILRDIVMFAPRLSAVGAALTVGYAIGRGIAAMTGLDTVDNTEGNRVGALTASEQAREARRQAYAASVAGSAGVSVDELRFARQSFAGAGYGVNISERDLSGTKLLVDLLGKVREQYGHINKDGIEKYIANEKEVGRVAAENDKAARESRARIAGLGVGKPEDRAKEFEKRFSALQNIAPKDELEKIKTEFRELQDLASAWANSFPRAERMEALRSVLEKIAGWEKKAREEAEKRKAVESLDEMTADWENFKKTLVSVRDEGDTWAEDQKQVAEENAKNQNAAIELYNESLAQTKNRAKEIINQNGSLEDRLKLLRDERNAQLDAVGLDKEKADMINQNFDMQEAMLKLEEKRKKSVGEQRDVMTTFDTAALSRQRYGRSLDRTKEMLEVDREILNVAKEQYKLLRDRKEMAFV